MAERGTHQESLDAPLRELRKAAGKVRAIADRREQLIRGPGPIDKALMRQAGPAVADDGAALRYAAGLSDIQAATERKRQQQAREVRKSLGVSEDEAYRNAERVAAAETPQAKSRRLQRTASR